jgi:hypothetical protein
MPLRGTRRLGKNVAERPFSEGSSGYQNRASKCQASRQQNWGALLLFALRKLSQYLSHSVVD